MQAKTPQHGPKGSMTAPWEKGSVLNICLVQRQGIIQVRTFLNLFLTLFLTFQPKEVRKFS